MNERAREGEDQMSKSNDNEVSSHHVDHDMG